MTELIKKSVQEFVIELSGKAPTPGGGGASALAGAIGIALGGMVANLTVGKNKYADVEDEMKRLRASADRVQNELLALIEKDADAFEPLAGAYRMPAGTDAEREAKARVMETSLKEASLVPLSMMKRCAEAIDLLREFAEKGSRLAVSDAACGAILCKAALQSAWLNVCVNTMSIRDRAFTDRVNGEGRELLEKYLPRADEIYSKIEEGFMDGV
ncbi:MAG: cyclodeaminase/cyclohydrolase family protein [Clostridiales Family XIII bacterium]|jgi:formiminotetrahydrofolate cyclodeaminase|nr:cyclodeaminase/cyclohydrolase family protein [Clostridiales Family XIII bacterium]